MNSLIFLISALFFVTLLIIVFMSRQRLQKIENKIFVFLTISNLIGLLIEILLQIVTLKFGIEQYKLLIEVLSKIYLSYLLIWFSVLTMYSVLISYKKQEYVEKFYSRVKKIIIIICILANIVMFFLPILFYYDNPTMYSYGLAVDLVKVIMIIYMFIWIIGIAINFKNLKQKKYFPIYAVIVLLIMFVLIQIRYPEVLLATVIGTFTCYLLFFTIENPDIKTIEELNVLKLQAESANNAKNEWLKQMRHELNTPVTVVQAYNEFNKDIASKIKNKKLLENTEYIDIGIKDIQAMISNAVAIAELENKDLVLEEKAYETNYLIERIKHLVENNYSVGKKNIKFNLNKSDYFPNILIGDEENVIRIIIQLLSNAFKYTDEGEVSLDLDAKINNNICDVIITVTDTGIGIKEEDMQYLFKKFERIDFESNQSDKRGIGLGLSVIKQLVELMGGNINASSKYKEGSKFIVTIKQKMPLKGR